MSAAGGAMMPPPGTAGLPLSSGAVRDIKDYSSEDKQVLTRSVVRCCITICLCYSCFVFSEWQPQQRQQPHNSFVVEP